MLKKQTQILSLWLVLCALSAVWSLPTTTLANAPMAHQMGFSPKDDALRVILQGIKQAEASILVAAYSFTSKPIALALVDAHKRGVKVYVVADKKSNSGQYSAVTFLANQGIPVRLNDRYAILHHKFMVFDAQHLETGSFNYSAAAAQKNAENVLLLYNVPQIAAAYIEEWKRLWDEGQDLARAY